jgi:holo-[acyl-carrier protein] synthase
VSPIIAAPHPVNRKAGPPAFGAIARGARAGYTLRMQQVLAHGLEIAAIEEAPSLDGVAVVPPFTGAEVAYARSKSDPQRRLAARLAAKRAATKALGGDLPLAAFEVAPARGGPPRLLLSAAGEARLRAIGGSAVLLSLTHGRTHAAAAVVVLGRRAP